MRILLIGAGVSSTSLLKHLTELNLDENVLIDLVDSKNHIGRGQAYIEDSDVLRANVPVSEMSLDKDATHYERWLKEQGYVVDRFSSRRQFGEYMEDVLMSIVRANDNIQVIKDKIEHLDYDGQLFHCQIGNKEKCYDIVYLGIGMLEYMDPYELKGMENFIYNPYPIIKELKDVKQNVAIVGTGLSGIDCLRYLLIERNLGKVYMFNRSNELPAVRGTHYDFNFEYFTRDTLLKYVQDEQFTLENVKSLFIKEMRYQEISLELFERKSGDIIKDLQFDVDHPDTVGKLEYFLIEFNKIFTPFLHLLSKAEQKKLFEEYQPYISSNYSPMPREVATHIIEWLQSGRLEMIEDLEEIEKKELFILTADEKQYEMDVVINATGTNMDITSTKEPLVQHLYMKKLIEPHHLGGLKVDSHYHVVSPKYGVIKNFFAFGELTIGMTYLSNAVFDIFDMTREIAIEIKQTANNPAKNKKTD